ncbi:SPFH domain-containing protein [Desulfosporosinus meridiei]|uniref:Putative virion core protein (Lumpy skin disease virus) n=1 Tax=Desulfosporosinus meridiei (strain ATCC BAA-275 / DSM 13257 / KCTC 12902 / NCIMB 13706 / S10) TaxID=768704 RepID=J7IXD9_DESMD|nr:SPFH domain-containing protein [Desulfosporosinus meridiei]AFQ46415.1 putative virion core protein (lumpy skin disease virus) [Desulfosporosinus meridiei DSM 13257]
MAIIDVIKYNGGSDVFAWKYPSEEIGTWTQLIVNESQEAILYKGGQALDLFTSGRHTLETANIPLLNNLINLPFGGRSPFAAEVWYINKIFSLDIKWGTPTPIQLQDPKYKVFVPLRSFGQFGIQIEDSRKFLMKLVGTLPIFDKDNITKYFRGLYLTKVKDAISFYIMKQQVSVLEINAYLDELSEHLKERMFPTLEEYGIRLVNFYVNDISVPEDDSAVMKLKEALAKKAEMNIVGYNYVQERSFDTLEGAATNPSSGQAGLMGAGIGLGMGVGIGGNFGQQMGGIAQTINTRVMKKCPICSTDIEVDKRFCGNCSFDTSANEAQGNSNNVTCSNCGYEFSKNMKFCPECGDTYKPCTFCGADLKEAATKCHVCGNEMPKPCTKCGALIPNNNIKFCPECGESQVKKCSNCGNIILGTPKFCSECGTKI